ncbi:N-acetyltransferase B complex non catalytic subunit-domain-containing protein [Pelagophyceae sp. CCMP2097]|nr:N-acetyltransferase B complex non catalytic subunit-domain-containing protein [Pelagophyceae sp. CCMP2097]
MHNRIYDAIDAGNYKSALKLCGKNPADGIVAALKALALQRSGRRQEAADLCRDIVRAEPTDENVLLPLTATLSYLGMDDDATLCWQIASTKRPTDESLARELFFCRVRRSEFALQRGVASKLFKLKPTTLHLRWCAAAALLEAKYPAAAGAMDRDLVLRLADKMAAKACFEEAAKADAPPPPPQARAASEDEVELLVAIRRERGDLAGALAAVRAARTVPFDCQKMMMQPMAMARLEASLLLEAGEVAAAADAYLWLVKQAGGEEWSDNMGLAASIVKCDATDSAKRDADARDVFSKCKGRGGALGVMELFRARLALGPEDVESKGQLAKLVLEYVSAFGSKLSCFDDVEPFLRSLAGDAAMQATLADAMDTANENGAADGGAADALKGLALDGAAAAAELDAIAAHATYFKCARFVGLAMPIESGAFEAKLRLEIEYARRAAALGDRPLSDDLALLVVATLVDRHETATKRRNETDQQALAEAWKILDWARYSFETGAIDFTAALPRRSAHAQVDLARLEASQRLGAAEDAVQAFSLLGVKQIQFDSLGWLLYPWAVRAGLFREFRVHLRNVLHVHRAARKDAAEFSVKAFESAHASRAVELAEFQRTRMDPSMQLALARSELLSLELVLDHHALKAARVFFATTIQGSELFEAGPKLSELLNGTQKLSVNHDWLAKAAWRHAANDHTSPQEKETCLKAYLVVAAAQRDLLHGLLNAVTDKAHDRAARLVSNALEKILAAGDADAGDADAGGGEDVTRAGRPGAAAPWLAHAALRPSWRCAAAGHAAVVAMRKCNAADGAAAASDDASLAPALAAIVAAVEAAAEAIVGAPSNDAWVGGAAVFVQHALVPLALAAQVLLESVPMPQKRGKGKKGAAPLTDRTANAVAAAEAVLAALARLAKALRFATSDAAVGSLRLLPESVDAVLTARLSAAAASSRKLSVQRLLDVVEPKRDTLAALLQQFR